MSRTHNISLTLPTSLPQANFLSTLARLVAGPVIIDKTIGFTRLPPRLAPGRFLLIRPSGEMGSRSESWESFGNAGGKKMRCVMHYISAEKACASSHSVFVCVGY